MPHPTSGRLVNLPSIREMFPGYLPNSANDYDTRDQNEKPLLQPCRFKPYASRKFTQSPSPLSSPSPQPEVPSAPAAVASSSHRRRTGPRTSQPAFRVNAQLPVTSTTTETSVLVNHRRSSPSATESISVPLTNTTFTKNFPEPNYKRHHICPVESCGKVFSSPFNLRSHFVVHTGAMPFECPHPQCGKRFNVISNMRRHHKSHSCAK